MTVEKIKSRHIVFRHNIAEWDLNIHLITGKENNYIIDTGLGPETMAPTLEYLKNDRRPIIIVNTHYHWDHIWGNGLFEGRTIISHALCRKKIEENWDRMLRERGLFIKGEVKKCLPTLVFEESLYFPDDKIRLIYTPGHTADSISVLDEEEGVINVADNVGDSMDEIMPSLETGIGQYIETLRRYKNLDFDTCVSGHNITLGKEIVDALLNACM